MSEFGLVTVVQRLTMKRLKERPILLCSYIVRMLAEKAEDTANVEWDVVKSKVSPESERVGMTVPYKNNYISS